MHDLVMVLLACRMNNSLLERFDVLAADMAGPTGRKVQCCARRRYDRVVGGDAVV